MNSDNQHLIDLLRSVSSTAPHCRLLLIGGLAVHVQVVEAAGDSAPGFSNSAELLASLPRLVRATADLDICLSEADLARVIQNLRSEGFTPARSEPPPHRYARGSEHVDLVALPNPQASANQGASLDLPGLVKALDGEFESSSVFDASVRIASPLALVIMKCVAWDTRHEARDLVDIARLALSASPELEAKVDLALGNLPRRAREAARRVRRSFIDPHGTASACMLPAVYGLQVVDPEDWETEELIREHVSEAVCRLLSRC
ncbi:MAG: nucleotidyltransferase family protein [Deltaproteobacteria bacterium]|nr:nucleotidyltransferase family protein [Deltaproteobacteria bacterium]